jgi:hypothetical protein
MCSKTESSLFLTSTSIAIGTPKRASAMDPAIAASVSASPPIDTAFRTVSSKLSASSAQMIVSGLYAELDVARRNHFLS